MPSRLPVPLPALPGGPLNPIDWISLHGQDQLGVQQSAIMRGTPGGLAAYQRRQVKAPSPVGQALPYFIHSRQYDRGAGAYAPQFGRLLANVIGAGIVATYRLPTIAGPGARYKNGAIWFDVQTIPTSLRISPTVPVEAVNAALATSYVAAMYPTTG